MKKLLFSLFVSGLLVACSSSENEKEEKKISKRDKSITAANSYSDLFLDSMLLQYPKLPVCLVQQRWSHRTGPWFLEPA
jgi:hypothetical protein